MYILYIYNLLRRFLAPSPRSFVHVELLLPCQMSTKLYIYIYIYIYIILHKIIKIYFPVFCWGAARSPASTLSGLRRYPSRYASPDSDTHRSYICSRTRGQIILYIIILYIYYIIRIAAPAPICARILIRRRWHRTDTAKHALHITHEIISHYITLYIITWLYIYIYIITWASASSRRRDSTVDSVAERRRQSAPCPPADCAIVY